MYVLESPKLIADQIAQDPALIEGVYVRDDVGFERVDFELTRQAFSSIQTTQTSQGVLAVVRQQPIALCDWQKVMVCDGVQDPSNLGAIIRSCVAFGFDGVVVSDCVDRYHPSCVRAATGLMDRISVVALADFEPGNAHVIGLAADATQSVDELVVTSPVVAVLGSEGQGISNTIRQRLSPKMVRLDMVSGVESLNVAVVAGVLGYVLFNR